MRTIRSLRGHHYLRSIGILLIAVALVAGILSCEPGETYELTMAANPTDGGTATDETGTGPYSALEVVDIKAVPADCHQFVNWEAPVGIIGNSTAAETTFIMPAQDITVTANFEPIPPNHYKFYMVDGKTAPYIGTKVKLEDQFGTFTANVTYADTFGNPVEKEHATGGAPIYDPNRHYTVYWLDFGEGLEYQVTRSVEVKNQFQENVVLTVVGPAALAVPTQKEGHEMVDCINHFLLYWVLEEEFPEESVNLKDQFIPDGEDVTVWGPYMFGNPVKKTVVGGAVSPIEDDDLHWVLYDIGGEVPSIEKNGLQITNQFGNDQVLDLTYRDTLAVPSEKISWEKPLSHFKTYWAEWPGEPPPQWEPPLPVDVQLEDQFVTINATVTAPFLFANPAEKEHGETWTPISDWKDHLTLYWIEYQDDPLMCEVTVNNQFGNNQWLEIVGPLWLAVPTGKLALEWPADLNHFLVYYVNDYDMVPQEPVYLWDQFMGQETVVGYPEFFAVPAKKIHDGVVTDIKDDTHLLFYWLGGGEFTAYDLPVVNQFGQQYLDLSQSDGELDDLLGVPSKKTEVGGCIPAPL
jgi:hypothetical protein